MARLEILAAAEARLREHGINGLNVVGVAGDCGMSHATVIHHFGNTDGMRRALVTHMSDRLLRDVIETLQNDDHVDPPAMLKELFATLSEGGHAKLLAWLSLSGEEFGGEAQGSDAVVALFAELVPVVAARLPEQPDRESRARRVIFLIITAAIGYGVGGRAIPAVVGLDDAEAVAFPEWLGKQVNRLLFEAPDT